MIATSVLPRSPCFSTQAFAPAMASAREEARLIEASGGKSRFELWWWIVACAALPPPL